MLTKIIPALRLNCKTKCDKEEITFHADLFMP